MPDTPPVRFDREVLYTNYKKLPGPAREALKKFLLRLQANPRDTRIYNSAQSSPDEFYAISFYEGWVVYWHLDVDDKAVGLFQHGVRYIYVLGLENKTDAKGPMV